MDSPTDDDGVVPWDAIGALLQGAALLKFGRSGEPHFRHFALTGDCRSLYWHSHKKAASDSMLKLQGCGLLLGQCTDVFKRAPRPDLADVSFSIIGGDEGGRRGAAPLKKADYGKKTLDVVCKNKAEYSQWTTALQYLVQGPPPAEALAARLSGPWQELAARGAAEWAPSPAGGMAASATTARPAAAARDSVAAAATPPVIRRSATTAAISRDLKRQLKATSDVFAVGANSWGQLGLGREASYVNSPALVPFFLGRAIRSVACGYAHAVALGSAGEAWAFGCGANGRLGTGRTASELTPRLIVRRTTASAAGVAEPEPYRFTAVACGAQHTIACDAAGVVYAWGAGTDGATGGGRRADVAIPVIVPVCIAIAPAAEDDVGGGATTAASAAHAAHSTDTLHLRAVRPPTIVAVSAGAGYSAMLDARGRVFTCGAADAPLGHCAAELRLATRARADPSSPESASPLLADLAMRCVSNAAAASVAGGTDGGDNAASWAVAERRRLTGDLLVPVQVLMAERRPAVDVAAAGTGVPSALPTAPAGGGDERVVSVSCGTFHMGATTMRGEAYTWGWGGAGALGHGDVRDHVTPARVRHLPRDVLSLACGGAHTLALVANRVVGRRFVYAWGSAARGQVPVVPAGAAVGVPDGGGDAAICVAVPRMVDLPAVPIVDGGSSGHLDTLSSVAAATPPMAASPHAASTLSAVGMPAAPSAIAAGALHSCVVTEDGALFVFGYGEGGALGITTGAGLTDAVKQAARARRAAAAAANAPQSSSIGAASLLSGAATSIRKVGLQRLRSFGLTSGALTGGSASGAGPAASVAFSAGRRAARVDMMQQSLLASASSPTLGSGSFRALITSPIGEATESASAAATPRRGARSGTATSSAADGGNDGGAADDQDAAPLWGGVAGREGLRPDVGAGAGSPSRAVGGRHMSADSATDGLVAALSAVRVDSGGSLSAAGGIVDASSRGVDGPSTADAASPPRRSDAAIDMQQLPDDDGASSAAPGAESTTTRYDSPARDGSSPPYAAASSRTGAGGDAMSADDGTLAPLAEELGGSISNGQFVYSDVARGGGGVHAAARQQQAAGGMSALPSPARGGGGGDDLRPRSVSLGACYWQQQQLQQQLPRPGATAQAAEALPPGRRSGGRARVLPPSAPVPPAATQRHDPRHGTATTSPRGDGQPSRETAVPTNSGGAAPFGSADDSGGDDDDAGANGRPDKTLRPRGGDAGAGDEEGGEEEAEETSLANMLLLSQQQQQQRRGSERSGGEEGVRDGDTAAASGVDASSDAAAGEDYFGVIDDVVDSVLRDGAGPYASRNAPASAAAFDDGGAAADFSSPAAGRGGAGIARRLVPPPRRTDFSPVAIAPVLTGRAAAGRPPAASPERAAPPSPAPAVPPAASHAGAPPPAAPRASDPATLTMGGAAASRSSVLLPSELDIRRSPSPTRIPEFRTRAAAAAEPSLRVARQHVHQLSLTAAAAAHMRGAAGATHPAVGSGGEGGGVAASPAGVSADTSLVGHAMGGGSGAPAAPAHTPMQSPPSSASRLARRTASFAAAALGLGGGGGRREGSRTSSSSPGPPPHRPGADSAGAAAAPPDAPAALGQRLPRASSEGQLLYGGAGVAPIITSSSSATTTTTTLAGAGRDGATALGSPPPLPDGRPLPSTLPYGPLPVLALARREVRSVAAGGAFTLVTAATEWMRDEEAAACMRCGAPFALGRRTKHHCRRCGGIVCEACSQHKAPLLSLGYIEPVRVCDTCWAAQ